MNGIMEILIDHEEAISRLYEAYAQKFPDHKEFWSKVSLDEKDHAEQIRQLSQMIKEGHAQFDFNTYKPIIIKISMDYIKKEVARTKNEEISMRTAISVALHIENAIVDGEVYESFKGYTAEAKSFIRECAASFAEHYRAIQDMWSAHRKFF
jgi:CTP:phosphocholine cytidylyltransferase-like protein